MDGTKLAMREAVDFLMALGIYKRKTKNGVLISVDTAVMACDKAGWGASLLAAMAGIAELQSHNAPTLPQAQLLLGIPSGLHAMPPVFPPFSECTGIAN